MPGRCALSVDNRVDGSLSCSSLLLYDNTAERRVRVASLTGRRTRQNPADEDDVETYFIARTTKRVFHRRTCRAVLRCGGGVSISMRGRRTSVAKRRALIRRLRCRRSDTCHGVMPRCAGSTCRSSSRGAGTAKPAHCCQQAGRESAARLISFAFRSRIRDTFLTFEMYVPYTF